MKGYRNPESWNLSEFINCELWTGDVDNYGDPTGTGEWVPFTLTPDHNDFHSVASMGVKTIAPPRDLAGELSAALRRGAPWSGLRLEAFDPDSRQRLMAAAQRWTAVGTLPMAASEFSYPTANGSTALIQGKDIMEASLAVQDYAESCYARYKELAGDPTADVHYGWPE